MVSAIPFIGPLITPMAKLGAHAYYGGMTNKLIAPKKSKQTADQTESKKSSADNPPADDSSKNKKPPNNLNNNSPSNLPPPPSMPVPHNPLKAVRPPSSNQKSHR